MKHRVAFAGFRHFHILELYASTRGRGDVEAVAACEPDGRTRQQLAGEVEFTHDDYDSMYAGADFDIVAVADYYGRRGEIIIQALAAGKHVIADKPICTRLEELKRIAELASANKLAVGCMLTMREAGNFRALREVIASGRLGEVQTVCFSGQHPLMRGQRPEWYFQPGGQGGTINDISIHAMDMIPWLTGRRIAAVVAARTWNARTEPNWFQDGAQLMLRLDNGGGVLGDVSYFAPDACGYQTPQYWRFTVHGTEAVAETAAEDKHVSVWTHSGTSAETVAPARPRPDGYLEDFLGEVRGSPSEDGLTTQRVLAASRLALLAQRAADEGLRDVPCE